MKTYKYDIAIAANSEQEADSKMTSLTLLATKLNAKELERLAYVVKNEPVTTALAKKALGL